MVSKKMRYIASMVVIFMVASFVLLPEGQTVSMATTNTAVDNTKVDVHIHSDGEKNVSKRTSELTKIECIRITSKDIGKDIDKNKRPEGASVKSSSQSVVKTKDVPAVQSEGLNDTNYDPYGVTSANLGTGGINAYNALTAQAKSLDSNIASGNIQSTAYNFLYVGGFSGNLTVSGAYRVFVTYLNNHPEAYWLSHKMFYYTSGGYVKGIYFVVDNDYASSSVRASINNDINNKMATYKSIAAKESGSFQKALAIQDYIIQQVDYTSEANEDENWAHNIVGVFQRKGAVCEGYAKSFQYILNAVGIDNIYITGSAYDGVSHAWNLVKMPNGKYYYFDVTWNDQPSISGGMIYCYFAMPEAEFLYEHTPGNKDYLYPLPSNIGEDGTYSHAQRCKKLATKSATCEHYGRVSYNCVVKYHNTPRVPHKWSGWVTKVKPTYTKKGTKVIWCVYCHKIKEAASIPKLKPYTPKSVKGSVPVNKSLKVSWKGSNSMSGYYIKIATNSKFTKGVKNIYVTSGKRRSVTIKKLTRGKKYYIKVKSYKKVGKKKIYGSYSKAASRVLLKTPKKQGAPKLSSTKGKIKIRWFKAPVTGYRLAVATNSKFSRCKYYNIGGRYKSKTIKVASGSKVYIKVRNYMKSGKNYVFGYYGKARKITVK